MEIARTWFRKIPVEPNLIRLDEPFVHDIFRSNIWFLEGRDADLLVDAGMGLADLAAALARPADKPLVVVATHGHADHVGSLHRFAERWGPAAERETFTTMADHLTYADMFRALKDPVLALPEPGWSAKAYRLRPAPLTRELNDGDTVDLGGRVFSVLHLPGHSPGSLGLFDETDGLLFSGDALYEGELYDGLPDSDRRAYRATMARIAELPARLVCAGHGEPLARAAMRAIALDYVAAYDRDGST